MKNVIYIDDDSEAQEAYNDTLQELFGDEFELISIEPKFDIKDMMQYLQSVNSVVAYILDEKLNQLGKAHYLGQELAREIRNINSKIPIYIFTAYKEEFDSSYGPAEIEYVIAKDELAYEDKKHSLSAKIRRHHNVFNDVLSERAQRLDELLIKSLNNNLTLDEQVEFERLNMLRSRSIDLQEADLAKELQSSINETDEKLAEIERLLKGD
ncbi:hypothetical protein ACK2VI_10590 [Klebsiella pneumoniae]|uniref:hypothetical protein n=1 Tax=Klebsiella pneumoniae TaxID=573 RepID=UPI001299A5FD|nr:hypothetical protein [Klebsiella pneumoniae]EIW9264538.1 hypothetical protein [Klebsiella pneumoniae]EIX9483597.1 hypothetical protein [Klebsiella pneumoniae]MBW5505687.1 hypothetical protein [Klebsiella pneumoniae]MCH0799791.1 hypothetical protein [Klebsiella pneumoniae]MCM6055679.1 hypothetical protein [Klebsiella pneumoniae]